MLQVQKEYFEAMLLLGQVPINKIAQLDAIDFLERLPNESVDLVITDPAYESLEKHRAKGTTTRLKESDSSSNAWFDIFRDAGYPVLLEEMYRVMKPATHAYIFCDETTCDVLKPLAREAGFVAWKSIVWVKTTKTNNGVLSMLKEAILSTFGQMKETLPEEEYGDEERQCMLSSSCHGGAEEDSMQDVDVGRNVILRAIKMALQSISAHDLADKLTRTGMGYHWRGASERILFLEKRTVRQPWPHDPHSDPKGKGRKLNHLGWKDVLYGTPVLKKGAYPTEKPSSVIKSLIMNSSEDGELVIDMFAGSGVVPDMAYSLGRNFLASDISKESMKYIEDRLEGLE